MGQRAVTPNGARIRELRVSKGWDVDDLADACQLSVKTIRRAESGKGVDIQSLAFMAESLEIQNVGDLIKSESTSSHPTPNENIEVYVGTYDNTAAIAAAIQKAKQHNKQLWMMLAPSIIALLCCLSGLAPIDARYAFLAGTLFAVIGFVLATQKRPLVHLPKRLQIAFPIIAIALNMTAYVAWPHAFGIFPVKGGYTFGFGERQRGWLSTKPLRRFYPVTFQPHLDENETAEISTDPDTVRWGSLRGENSGVSVLCYVELETGANTISLRRRGLTKTISCYIHPDKKITYIGNEKLTLAYNNRRKDIPLNGIPFFFQFESLGDLLQDTFSPSGAGKSFVVVTFFRNNIVVKPDGISLIAHGDTQGDVTILDGTSTGFYSSSGWHYMQLLRDNRTENDLMFWVDVKHN